MFSKEFQAERLVLLHDFSGESNFQGSKTILILLMLSSKFEEFVTLWTKECSDCERRGLKTFVGFYSLLKEIVFSKSDSNCFKNFLLSILCKKLFRGIVLLDEISSRKL